MASGVSRGSRCRERSRRGRVGRGLAPTGRSRSRGREGESGALQESPLGDPDCLGPPEEGVAANDFPSENARNQKAKSDPNGRAPEGHGEPSMSSENGAVAHPMPAGKRGRKPKAEMLLLKLSQDLECPAPESICVQKMLGSSEGGESLENPPGGRPKRRAAKVVSRNQSQSVSRRSAGAGGGKRRRRTVMTLPTTPTLCPRRRCCCRQRRRRRRRRGAMQHSVRSQNWSWSHSEDTVGGHHLQGDPSPSAEELLPTASTTLSWPQWRSAPTSPAACGIRSTHSGSFQTGSLQHTSGCGSRKEEKSPLFSIQREGIKDDGALYRVNRFSSLQPHQERLDVSFFVGGPVWAMEWCPSPEGSAAPQYVALYCHRSMEETHGAAGLHRGPALLQLWGLGSLQPEQGSTDKAELAYAIAADHGCVWDMKFCPSGAWEPPSTARMHPQMGRLGLLAVAFSEGKVVLYSLPHPGALRRAKRTQTGPSRSTLSARCSVWPRSRWAPSSLGMCLSVGSASASPGCPASPTTTWQLVSMMMQVWLQATRSSVLCCLQALLSHCTVAIWNLLTKSLLQCVRQPDGSLKLYPFQCFLAHDQAVRSMEWCKADSNFLVTAGSDRKIKFWDLRRLYEPINSIKRFLSTEVAWLLPYNGVTVAQDNCYASYGLCGIHYIDAGYLGFKAYFVAPRKGTVWSISGSDWLNTVAAGDITGELVAAVLPDLAINPLNIKRSSDRRFPVYKADLLPRSPDGPEGGEQALPKTRSYSEMVTKSYIRYQDTDLRSFKNFPGREPMRRMQNQESKAELSLDRLQLESLHKVRFSPNLDSLGWLVSGGQAGIVRAHCLVGLSSSTGRRLLPERRARFTSLYGDKTGSPGPPEDTPLPAE
ncbi:general transcription factor 3C polypeptide 2 isoform X4 [Heliangelus exortis]|uniref:general transcription factor 3C polypeptide 2 isoform X4 n=1 Tax=Heliangelus exortis TaxID=472823 RepID=UPI003A92FB1B